MLEGLWLWIKENLGLSIGFVLLALLALGNIIKNAWKKRKQKINKALSSIKIGSPQVTTKKEPLPVTEPASMVKKPVVLQEQSPPVSAETTTRPEEYPVLAEVFEEDWDMLREEKNKSRIPEEKPAEEERNPSWVSSRISQRLGERVTVMQQELEAVQRSVKELAEEQRERKRLFEDLLDKEKVLKEMIGSLNDHTVKQAVTDAAKKE